jgi:DNA-binding response OmpR family regulator
MKKRILLISYEEILLHTWKMILEQAGFEVFPALGFAEALEICQVRCVCDLVIMGHSMPQKDQAALLAAVRLKCKAPLLSLRKHSEPSLPEAEYSVDSIEGPAALLAAVKKALKMA